PTPPPPIHTLFPYTTLFRSHQVIGRHLVAPPGRGVVEQPVGIVPGLDQDAARARDAGEARTFAQLLHGPADELVDIAMIVGEQEDRKSTRLNSSHVEISYAV